jgi:hypothetical protein
MSGYLNVLDALNQCAQPLLSTHRVIFLVELDYFRRYHARLIRFNLSKLLVYIEINRNKAIVKIKQQLTNDINPVDLNSLEVLKSNAVKSVTYGSTS